jgi:hypothetical protein
MLRVASETLIKEVLQTMEVNTKEEEGVTEHILVSLYLHTILIYLFVEHKRQLLVLLWHRLS